MMMVMTMMMPRLLWNLVLLSVIPSYCCFVVHDVGVAVEFDVVVVRKMIMLIFKMKMIL